MSIESAIRPVDSADRPEINSTTNMVALIAITVRNTVRWSLSRSKVRPVFLFTG